MNQEQLLHDWFRQKISAGEYFELRKPLTIQYELRTQPAGCYSDYAYVCFDCAPAPALSFDSMVDWPEAVEPAYRARVEQAVRSGVFDILLGRNQTPYRSCAVRLSVALWDYNRSSEGSFYRATRAAMEKLIDKGEWRFVRAPGI